MKAIIIDEIKGLFQKEKEKIESQLNQINEELIKINERLKTCEDEINQLKVQLKGNGKNNESNNLHLNDLEKNNKKKRGRIMDGQNCPRRSR